MLKAPAFLDQEAGAALGRLASLPEEALRGQVLGTVFAVRQYHWLKHYAIHPPRRPTRERVRPARGLPRSTRLSRPVDSTATLCDDGAFLVNGHRIGELAPEQDRGVRFCMGVHTGAASREFRVSDVPGSGDDVDYVVGVLLEIRGLEIVRSCDA
ncbi:unnamed protein product [Prorocentrum cordatum]|uniref:Uncharacterized protein n=1 Tax=Prorocentrum cordatum TaxID=2364126 RepID=A0ABN9RWH9_9DINO|nr:unnamed protein product [Polarella glacialis]